jgi:hypothetical protein
MFLAQCQLENSMSTLTLADIPLDTGNPAQRLRRIAAAVRVHFTWWGVHRTLTSRQKEEVGDAYGADSRFLTAGKKIIDVRHDAFRKLTSLRSRILSYWRGLTLPYTEPGLRLIRQADVEGFVHKLEEFKEELQQAESDLDAVYEQVKSEARRRLGRLYDAADYPPQVRGLFGVAWDFPSVEPPNYLMRIAPEVYEQEQQRVAQRFEEAVHLAEQAFVSEFARLVSHLTERLADGQPGQRRIFRDSVVGNLTEFFERFKHLNVRSSQELDQLVEDAQNLVKGVSPQDLRDNEGLRRQVASAMVQVQTQLEGMIVDRPRRQIIRPQAQANGGSHAPGY